MKVISVYEQYFHASCMYQGEKRRAALVSLVSAYDDGNIKYEVKINFFPFRDPEDFVETFDACVSEVIYDQPGRRSKKREAAMIEQFREVADRLAAQLEGEIFWDRPLREARFA